MFHNAVRLPVSEHSEPALPIESCQYGIAAPAPRERCWIRCTPVRTATGYILVKWRAEYRDEGAGLGPFVGRELVKQGSDVGQRWRAVERVRRTGALLRRHSVRCEISQ